MRGVLFATLLLLQLGACFERTGEVTLVSESEPLTVKIDPGSEVIDWVWFQGPLRNKLANGPEPPPRADPKDVIVWQITPHTHSQDRRFSSPDKFPVITYGKVPEEWVQQLPTTGSPPPLLDGYVYTVSVITFRNPRPRALCVYVKNGRFERYRENGEDSLCKE